MTDRVTQVVGRNVRSERERQGLSLRALAVRLHTVSDHSSLSRLECGGQRITVDMLVDFATALDVEPAALLDVAAVETTDVAAAIQDARAALGVAISVLDTAAHRHGLRGDR
jgi:transcriptional regulator with XRE-family HTH domain